MARFNPTIGEGRIVVNVSYSLNDIDEDELKEELASSISPVRREAAFEHDRDRPIVLV